MNKKFKIGNIEITKEVHDLDDHDFAKALNYAFDKFGNTGVGILAILINIMIVVGVYNMLSTFF